MARVERLRETVSELPSDEEIRRKEKQGWKLAAVEWQREAPADAEVRGPETPYGLQSLDGSTELLQNGDEEAALQLMLGLVIDDNNSLAAVAAELNRRGLRTRSGGSWSAGAVFNMLPRLVEVAPRLFDRPDWSADTAVVH